MSITAEEYVTILAGLALQHERTLAAREATAPIEDHMIQMMYEMAESTSGVSEVEKANLRSRARGLKADPRSYQPRAMLRALKYHGRLIMDLVPVVLKNSSRIPFVFGDAPVVLYNTYCKGVRRRGVLGWQSPGLQLYYPVNPRTALLLIDEDKYLISHHGDGQVKLGHDDVDALNRLQLHAAAKAVYTNEPRYLGYLRGVWEQEKRRLSAATGKVVVAPGVSSEGALLGEIHHTFRPQQAFLPELSFIEHESLDDEGYEALVRDSDEIHVRDSDLVKKVYELVEDDEV